MKLNNIKVGDNVFIEEEVTYGFARSKSFKVPVKVVRLTKTLVVCEGGTKYKKDSGEMVGSGSVRKWVDTEGPDQTKEMEVFLKHVAKLNKTRHLIDDLGSLRNKVTPELEDEVLDNFIKQAQDLQARIVEIQK